MAPKHALQAGKTLAKRVKKSPSLVSRSSSPAEIIAEVSFLVQYPPADTKRKLSKKEQELFDHREFQTSPFEAKGASKKGELDQFYTVTPSADWESMKIYNNFILLGTTYKKNQFVYVRRQDTPEGSVEEDKDFWVARILQVRATNPKHVYALVAWLYWPEELPSPKTKASDTVNSTSGQRRYHGSQELIASNYMDVVNVLCVVGPAVVYQWEEDDDELTSELYWRQTFCRETQTLSALRKHCICDGYFNPEVAMMICDNEECKLWMHEECLIDDILTKRYERVVEDGSEEADANGAAKPASKKGKSGRKIWKGKFDAKFHTDDTADGSHTTVTITDLRSTSKGPKTWDERVACLKCSSLLD